MELTRIRWFRPAAYKGGISSVDAFGESASPEKRDRFSLGYARSMLDAQVRRQCQGRNGMWGSPDDSQMPEGLKGSFDPW